MCLIIHKPAGQSFNPTLFSVVKFHNPHGFGIMYPEDGIVRARKGLMTLGQIMALWDEHKDKHLAIHFRYATEGTVTPENCHPFRVLNKAEHGRDLYMMHNGTIRAVPIKQKDRSDTFHFVTHYLAPLLQDQPGLIDNEKFQEFISGMIGESKLLFMDGDGQVIIINRNKGSTAGDVWVSNQYSLKYPKPDNRRGAKAAAAAKAATTATVATRPFVPTTALTASSPWKASQPSQSSQPSVSSLPSVINNVIPIRPADPTPIIPEVTTVLNAAADDDSGQQLAGILRRAGDSIIPRGEPVPFIPADHYP